MSCNIKKSNTETYMVKQVGQMDRNDEKPKITERKPTAPHAMSSYVNFNYKQWLKNCDKNRATNIVELDYSEPVFCDVEQEITKIERVDRTNSKQCSSQQRIVANAMVARQIEQLKGKNNWTIENTLRFYYYLKEYKMQFDSIIHYFPDYKIQELELKFHKEKLINKRFIDKVLKDPKGFDMNELHLHLSQLESRRLQSIENQKVSFIKAFEDSLKLPYPAIPPKRQADLPRNNSGKRVPKIIDVAQKSLRTQDDEEFFQQALGILLDDSDLDQYFNKT